MQMDTCVLLLVKHPEKGQVKSRLTQHINPHVVLEIYKSFVLDMISTLKRSLIPFMICVHPPGAIERVRAWLGPQYEYIPQRGRAHSERLKNALIDAFKTGYDNAMALASDVPDLPLRILSEASSTLETHASVIGPSPDGGYYLIGFQRAHFVPEAFEGIRWSTASAFSDTVSKLEQAGIKAHILPEWRDVDTIQDLKSLTNNSGNPEFRSSRTMKQLLLYKAVLNRC